jgi:uncharacterized tellurite resistance protein B-like protein
MDLNSLTHDEKVFFAGSLRAMILADGVIEDAEIAWVDRIRDEDRFEDMDQCLDEFTSRVEALGGSISAGKPPEAYWQLAAQLSRVEAQRSILGAMEQISMRDGYQKKAEVDFFVRLRETWGIAR